MELALPDHRVNKITGYSECFGALVGEKARRGTGAGSRMESGSAGTDEGRLLGNGKERSAALGRG